VGEGGGWGVRGDDDGGKVKGGEGRRLVRGAERWGAGSLGAWSGL